MRLAELHDVRMKGHFSNFWFCSASNLNTASVWEFQTRHFLTTIVCHGVGGAVFSDKFKNAKLRDVFRRSVFQEQHAPRWANTKRYVSIFTKVLKSTPKTGLTITEDPFSLTKLEDTVLVPQDSRRSVPPITFYPYIFSKANA